MYLVFDVGATFVKYAWMTGDGEIIEKDKIPTRNRQGETVEDFLDSLVEVYEQYKLKGEVEGIAMGLPGQIDVEKGIVYNGGGLKYLHEVHLAERLSERCDGIKVTLENDGKCAALAEIWLGNAKECQSAFVFVLGSGIGGASIIDRHVYHGNRLQAGEISFCFNEVKRKDLDHFVSIESLPYPEKEYEEMPYIWATVNSARSLCYRIAMAKGMQPEEVNGEKIFAWDDEGDAIVHELLEDFYFDIAKYCCNIYMIMDPDIILIGGGMSAQPRLVEGIKRYVSKLSTVSRVYSKMNVDVCKFRNDSNLLGALYNFKQQNNLL